MKNGVLNMHHETFRDGLIIIDEPAIGTVTLASPNNKYGVTVDISNSPLPMLMDQRTNAARCYRRNWNT